MLSQHEDVICYINDMEDVKKEEKHVKRFVDIAATLLVSFLLGFIVCYLAFDRKQVINTAEVSNKRMLTRSNVVRTTNATLKDELPNCEIHPSLSCVPDRYDTPGDMDTKWANHQWNTPSRGSSDWHQGFQDMNVLTGYAQQKYNSDHSKCSVTIITKTSKKLDLIYYFDDVAQETPSKDFDKSYNKVLKIKIVAKTGESLILDGIDFIWNVQPLKERPGDYRNGQKGAIVELFGWPDEDIEEECRLIGEAGYLGVKLFPHHEQLMSVQPFEFEMNPWYFMYQPVSYKLQGRMGTRDQLRNMINKCRSHGVRVYHDAVVNHMTSGGNDAQWHRNPNAGCTYWPPKNSSAGENLSPFYTHSYTYKFNERGEPSNVLEFPGVPYGPMDFHCDKALNSWGSPINLNTGWLVGLSDLDTSHEYVRQRIADYFVDMLSIGFTGFRIDAAKHIHPDDIAAILSKFKEMMGGSLPEDWFTWLEVIIGGEGPLLVGDSKYSYTGYLTKQLEKNGLTQEEIKQVRIWWASYPAETLVDQRYGSPLDNSRKVIQNDDHDQQNDGSSSRSFNGKGCVLATGCQPEEHRRYEVTLFTNPYDVSDNDNDYPIRMILSSYYFQNGVKSIPDGKSDCSLCKVTCDGCKSRSKATAYLPDKKAYEGQDYTRVHRDEQIIAAMRKWMHI